MKAIRRAAMWQSGFGFRLGLSKSFYSNDSEPAILLLATIIADGPEPSLSQTGKRCALWSSKNPT